MLTEQQLEARRAGLGGSDVAAILGMSPWRTPLDVWLEKTGQAQRPKETPAMYWGIVLEDTVANEYAKRTGYKIQRRNKILAHKAYPVMRALLDRVIISHPDGPGVLECKTARHLSDEWGDAGTDNVPNPYLLQVAHYLAVTGYAWAELPVLFLANREFRIYRFHRDDELIQSLVELETQWWRDHIEANIPPDPTTTADLIKRYPRSNGTTAVASQEAVNAWQQLKEIKAQISELEKAKEKAENTLKKEMGEAETLSALSLGVLASWKAQTVKRLNQTRLKEERPEIYSRFSEVSEHRTLRIK
jgi:putative phage-type endonuclease